MDISYLNILLVEKDNHFADKVAAVFSAKGCAVLSVKAGTEASPMCQKGLFDLVLVNRELPDQTVQDFLKSIPTMTTKSHVIIYANEPNLAEAVECIRMGAYEYVKTPASGKHFISIIEKFVKNQPGMGTNIQGYPYTFERKQEKIIGQCEPMQNIFAILDRITESNSTVLITGESGTGKELIARAIHSKSNRSKKPFFAMDCGSLVETLFESELFGHVKGSFTGAHTTKHGAIELANNGTFFFDEIGNISLNVQAKILRVLQEREIRRIGATKSTKVNVRMIAATNMNLLEAISNNQFREDLYYRLSVIPIHLPPLRERKNDIFLLVDYFLQKYRKKSDKNIFKVSDQAMDMLTEYHWPGNIRELENTIERAAVIEDSTEITVSSLPNHFKNDAAISAKQLSTLEKIIEEHIKKVLEHTNRNIAQSARILNIDRKTLYDKIRKYDL